MATIRDVMDTCEKAKFSMRHFGCTKAWRTAFEGHISLVGKAIVSDVVDSNKLVDLSPNIKLGPLGELAYVSLRLFILGNTIRRTDSPL